MDGVKRCESTMFVATAIEPDLEYKVCPERPKRVAKGSTLLTQQQRGMTLIGKTLSDSLKANPGSTLVMQAAGPHASTNALDIEVSGYLPTLNLIESKRMATVQVGFAQELLRMKGQVTEYVVGVHNLEQMNDVAQRLRTELGDDYQVTTWEDIDPGDQDARVVFGLCVPIFIAVVLFLLVATGIVNTMMMSVYERVREIGTMLAVGVRRWQVTALFLLEAMALGLTSSVFGSLLGYVVVLWLGQRGIPMRPPVAIFWTYPHVQPSFMLIVTVSITGAVLSALSCVQSIAAEPDRCTARHIRSLPMLRTSFASALLLLSLSLFRRSLIRPRNSSLKRYDEVMSKDI